MPSRGERTQGTSAMRRRQFKRLLPAGVCGRMGFPRTPTGVRLLRDNRGLAGKISASLNHDFTGPVKDAAAEGRGALTSEWIYEY